MKEKIQRFSNNLFYGKAVAESHHAPFQTTKALLTKLAPLKLGIAIKTARFLCESFKGALSCLSQFLAIEIMKNSFCFTSKALFVIKIFKFLF